MAESAGAGSTCTCTQSAHRKGRTARTRKVKSADQGQLALSHHSLYVKLFSWLKRKHGCRVKNLVATDFSETGRGLKTKAAISPGDTLLSLPVEALITPETVLSSAAGTYIKRCTSKLTAHQAMCVFLMYERHLGMESEWAPYIDVLPRTFTTPGYFSDKELQLLPPAMLAKSKQHLEMLNESYDAVRQFTFECWEEMLTVFTRENFRWSWYAVNTRSVYLELPPSNHLQAQDNSLALAPVLDLLNHSPSAQVKAGLNRCGSHYEIITFDHYRPHQQVFIVYGAHDNTKLFMEYGFTIPHNPNNIYEFSKEDLRRLLTEFHISNLPQKSSCIQEAQLKGLTASEDGLSWKLLTFLRIVSMTWDELQNWKVALLGDPVSEQNEMLAQKMAVWLINKALHDHRSMVKKEPCPSVHEQLAESLYEDELCILETCKNGHGS